MKKFSFSFFISFLLATFCTSICFAEFGNNNLANEPETNSQKTREELIEGIRKRLQSVQGKMNALKKKDRQSLKTNSPKKPSPALISLTNIRNPKAVQIFLLPMKTILKAVMLPIGVKIPLACISFHSLGCLFGLGMDSQQHPHNN